MGAIFYTFAFVADWTHSPDFDYQLLAKGSVVFLSVSVAVAGCCTYTTQKE